MGYSFYKNYPKEFYLINNLISEIKNQINFSEIKQIFVTTYDYVNRCVNFYAIADQCKRFQNSCGPSFEGIKAFLEKKGSKDLQKYIEKYFYNDRFRETSKYFKSKGWKDSKDDELHYRLAEIYHFFPVNPNKYIDGIMKQHAWKKPSFVYSIAQTNNPKYPWIKLKTSYSNNWVWVNQEDPSKLRKKEPQKAKQPGWNPLFFYKYLYNIFINPDFKSEEFKSPELSKVSFIVIPVFDAGIPYENIGNLLCHIYLLLNKGATSFASKKDLIEKIWRRLGPRIVEIAFEARRHELISLPIKYGDDVLKDLLWKVSLVQDWERAMVFKNFNEQSPLYCFKRFVKSQNIKYEEIWNICEECQKRGGKTFGKCIKDAKCYGWLKKILKSHSPGNHSLSYEIDNVYLNKKGGRCFFVQKLDDILDPKILPSLEETDNSRYKNYIICFEFPKYTFFPSSANNADGKKEAIRNLGKHYFNKLIPIFDQLLLKKKVLRHSTLSAVSAIISRNHSHHIGSHVTPRTSVEQIKERLQKWNGKSYYKIPSNHLTVIGLLKDRLDRYIQQKAEFTAEIATNPLLSTKSALLFSEVLLGFIENTLLMDNIGANEEVRYNEKGDSGIRIHFLFGGKELVARYCDVDNGDSDAPHFTSLNYPYIACEEKTEIQPLKMEKIEIKHTGEDGKDDDPRVALPGPVGEYAIYAFLENLIRNSIKHNRDNLKVSSDGRTKCLDIYFSVSEGDDEFYTVQIWDAVTKETKKADLEEYIKKSLVKEDGELEKENWGIAEMKIMATLLKGSDDFLDISDNLKVETVNGGFLGYTFKVMKAKELAIISHRVNQNYDALKKKGIWCFPSLRSFHEYLDSRDKPFSSSFVAIDNPSSEDISLGEITDIAAKLPFRVIIHWDALKNGSFSAIPGSHLTDDAYFVDLANAAADPDRMIKRTWKEWLGRFSGEVRSDNVTVALYLEQSLRESPSCKWKELTKEITKEINEDNKKEQGDGTSALTLIYTTGNVPNLNAVFETRSKVALYDRHGQGQVYFSNRRFDHSSVVFYEAFDKNSPDFGHLFTAPRSKITFYELMEAALLNILIMDERVSEVAKIQLRLPHPEYLFRESLTTRLAVAKRAGIYICTHLCTDPNDPNKVVALHKCAEDVAAPIRAGIFKSGDSVSISVLDCSAPCKKTAFDAVVIHQGIMDGILKELIESLGGQTAFLDGLKKTIPYVVVDSGRGIPPQLSKKVKFLPFSILQAYLLGPRIAKIGLVKEIMTLTRRK